MSLEGALRRNDVGCLKDRGIMKIEECQGYKNLMESVMRDADQGQGCFNPNGCSKEFYRTVPQDNPAMIEMGIKTSCRRVSKCFHTYCDKFRWVIDRASHYAEKTGFEASEILDVWESGRGYWYMNYYQDSNQPLLTADRVKVFNTQKELLQSIGEAGFRCPMCGGISNNPYECNTGLEMTKGKVCDWKVYGLFRDIGKGIFVFVKEKMHGEALFMPVAWEIAKEVAQAAGSINVSGDAGSSRAGHHGDAEAVDAL